MLFLLAILPLAIFITAGIYKSINYEQGCCAEIQEQQFTKTKEHISIEEARARLDMIVGFINGMNEKSANPKFMSLRDARTLAVKLHGLHVAFDKTIPEILEILAKTDGRFTHFRPYQ